MVNCLSQTNVVCVAERNAKWRATETLGGGGHIIHFDSFVFLASCTFTFKDIPLNIVQLDWFSACRTKEFE